jgi:ribonuclease PH
LNLVMTATGRFIEIQGSGEETTFDSSELEAMITLGKKGIDQLLEFQKLALNQSDG